MEHLESRQLLSVAPLPIELEEPSGLVAPSAASTLDVVFTVNSILDTVDVNPGDGYARDASGLTSLRAAVMEANALSGAQTINLPAGTYRLTLGGMNEDGAATGDLDINGSLSIVGAGASQTIIDATGLNDRIFDMKSGWTTQLQDLTIKGGRISDNSAPGDCGGGIRVEPSANVTLSDCILKENSAPRKSEPNSLLGSGGAIYSSGVLTILGSRFEGNSASNLGGAICVDGIGTTAVIRNTSFSGNRSFYGGAIDNHGTVSIESSTFSDNTTGALGNGSGGALRNLASLTLTNCTISHNGSGNGGGIFNSGTLTILNNTITGNLAGGGSGLRNTGTASLENTIIAGNFEGWGYGTDDVWGTITSLGHNLIGNTAGSTGFGATGDLLNVDAKLGPLADNGGPAPTHMLLMGSPAINAANPPTAPAMDQREVARPQGSAADIGAVERIPGSISGTVWNDFDSDGARDAGEPGLAGVTIYLDLNQNGQLDAGERSTVTDAKGNYEFSEVSAGTYTVAEVVSEGWEQTSPTGGAHTVQLAAGEDVAGKNLGNRLAGVDTFCFQAAVDGYATDSNRDGTFESLDTTSDTFKVALSSSGSGGQSRGLLEFRMPGIDPNAVVVAAYLQFDPYVLTIPIGSEFTVDVRSYTGDGALTAEDATAATSFTRSAVVSDSSVLSIPISAPFVQDMVATGGCAGLQIVATTLDTSLTVHSTEGAFPGVCGAPILVVQVEQPKGGTIRGTIWNDLDGGGTHDKAESGMAGIQVFLDQNDNGQFDSGEPNTRTLEDYPGTYADETGTYVFADLNAGTYTVAQLVPETWEQATPTIGTHTIQLALDQEVTGKDFGNRRVGVGTSRLVASADGYAKDEDHNGVFEGLDTTSTEICVTHYPAGYAEGEHRGLLEFDLSGIDPEASIVAAYLQLGPAALGHWDNGVTLDVLGYEGDGVLTASDVTGTASLVGQAVIRSSNTGSIPIDSAFVQNLLATGAHVGLRLQATTLYTYLSTPSTEGSFPGREPAKLVIQTRLPQLPETGEIRGTTWNDLDDDGAWDTEEPGLANWQVYVDSNTNGQFDSGEPTTTTAADGSYVFTDVPPGTYAVAEVPQSRWLQTFPSLTPEPIERVSVAFDGSQANQEDHAPSISADGRYVAFDSEASDLVPGDTNGQRDVFVYDRQTNLIERVSLASDGSQTNGNSNIPSISADGRYVAFTSAATNLVPGDTNSCPDVFVYDRQTDTIERVSISSDASQANRISYTPSLSADGRYVAFQSEASNLVPGDTNGKSDIFVYDRQTGAIERVSIASDGSQANLFSFNLSISASGRYVAFDSSASNLVPGDTNGKSDIFVYDRQTDEIERVSLASGGSQANGESNYPSISDDGRYVAFVSSASNLVLGDTNGYRDTFVYDRQTDEIERVSLASDGSQANGESYYRPALSGDGRYVAFDSYASNLVPGDTNGYRDTFVTQTAAWQPGALAVVLAAGQVAAGIDFGNHAQTAPVAADDAYQVDEDTMLTVAAPGVLANDTGADGDLLSAVLAANPLHGSLTLNSDGSFEYTPEAGFRGTDSFSYWASDGVTNSTGSAMVQLCVEPPTLLRDINTEPYCPDPTELVAVGDRLFFVGSAPGRGKELWLSDGVASGTRVVKDINPGAVSSNPANLTNVDGTLFFTATGGTGGTELWKSDGTEVGTQRVKDIYPGTSSSSPHNLTDVNGTLFFAANDGTGGTELWKSDGTEVGTQRVKDIYPGTNTSSPYNLTNVNGTLFFMAQDSTGGQELWKSDGTDAGTQRVKDIYPGTSSSSPGNLTNVNGMLFFTANDGTGGFELWKSDGTDAGTVRVKDIVLGSGASSPANLTNVNGTLFFTAYDSTAGMELWKSDGTEVGTQRVKDIYPGTSSLSPGNLTNVNGTLFFTANDGTSGFELWRSDGTEAGTQRVKDIVSGAGSSSPTNLTNVNGTLFFAANDGTGGFELWKSDGTDAGTVGVKDIIPGMGVSLLQYLTNVNGTLFFRATDSIGGGFELWKSDGTEAGTSQVSHLYTGTDSSRPGNLTNVNGMLFFTASDGAGGTELWKSDGTEAGTVRLKDIIPGNGSSYPESLTNVNGILFFTAEDSTGDRELWKSDGTEAGTIRIKDILPGAYSSSPYNLTNVNGTLFFTAYDGISGTELWKSDGTEAGTVRVKDIFPGTNSSSPANLTNVNGTLFFTANDGMRGTELWRSNGTEAGTFCEEDVVYGPGSSSPANLTSVNGSLFFTATVGTSGTELWACSGNWEGVDIVKDIYPGASSSSPANLTNVNGTLFFTATSGTGGIQLWKSHGALDNTVSVVGFAPVQNSPSLAYLTNVNGTIFFTAVGSGGFELWKSDGTVAGTVRVKDILSPGSSYPDSLTNINGTLFFSATDATGGRELWRSDGTEAGTKRIADLAPGIADSSPSLMTSCGDWMAFVADDGFRGGELWSLNIARPTVDILDVVSDPQNPTTDSITIQFSEPVFGFGLEDLRLTYNGGSTNLLTVSQPLTSSDGGRTWILGNLASLTSSVGSYQLLLTAAGSSIENLAGNRLVQNASDTWGGVVRVLDDGDPGFTATAGWTASSDAGACDGDYHAAAMGDGNEKATWTFTGLEEGRYRIAATWTAGAARPTNAPYTVFSVLPRGTVAVDQQKTPDDLQEAGVWWETLGDFKVARGTLTVELTNAVNADGVVADAIRIEWVGPVINKAPVAVDDVFTTGNGQVLTVAALGVLANDTDADGDVLSAALADGPKHGSLVLRSDGSFEYTPEPGFRGTDTFTYWASDSLANSTSVATAQIIVEPPQLLKDVNAKPYLPNPTNSVVVGNRLFFAGSANGRGIELWVSDGTPTGTRVVKDIFAGSQSSNPSSLTNVNGTLFFLADDGGTGKELWKSDGTEAGTVRVKDICAGPGSSNAIQLTDVNGILFFSAMDSMGAHGLWKSDGTEAGTVRVKSVSAGDFESAYPSFANVNGTLFFMGNDGTSGWELWKSDGTEAGTVRVKDIYAGSGSSDPSCLTNVNGMLFFAAADSTGAYGLWKSDGTASGTVRVKDFYYGLPESLTNVNGTLFFTFTSYNYGANGQELWKSDGTAAGTVLVKDIYDGSTSSNPRLTDVNGTLFFRAFGNLWKTDGTEAGTVRIVSTGSGNSPGYPSGLKNLNGILFFAATDSTGTYGLWKSDGTAAGTVRITSPDGPRNPKDLRNLNGTLIFAAGDSTAGYGLWKSDGTKAGTVSLAPETYPADPSSPTNVNGTLFFVATDGITGNELWKSDGTEAGTVRVKDILPGIGPSSPTNLTSVNGTLFFTATENTGDTELWKSDGTEAGTVRVKDIVLGRGASSPVNLTNVNGTLFFTALDGTDGRELWKSDGTEAGTVRVKDIRPGLDSSSPSNLTNINGTLFFTAQDSTGDRELWMSDGTEAGTVCVKDIMPGSVSSSPASLTNANGTLFFTAYDSTAGRELWKSDGTEAGTIRVKDVFVGGGSSNLTSLTNVNGTLFFTAYDSTGGTELWNSDGTEAGTIRVKDIVPGPASSSLSNLTGVNGTLFFTVAYSMGGYGLWKSDGTQGGTALVKDIYVGTNSGFSAAYLTNVNGRLFFAADDGKSGGELWTSDGTAEGTALYADLRPGFPGSAPRALTVIDHTLFFVANDGYYGSEVWKLGLNAPPTDVALANKQVPEQAMTGTLVGLFSTTDPDTGDTHAYSLVSGDGSEDNASFTIVGNQLQTNASFDFETKSVLSIRVRATDNQGLAVEKAFTISVTDVNEPPSVTLVNTVTSLAENTDTTNPIKVADIVITDDALGSKMIYQTGPNVGLFEIAGGALYLRAQTVLDYEVLSQLQVTVQVDDSSVGATPDSTAALTIAITNVNEAPTEITLSAASLAENLPAGTAIGTFATTDPDGEGTFVYALVAGEGSTDNAQFTIVGNELRAAVSLDYEAQASYAIRVESTDSGGLSVAKNFTITVTDVNEPPSVSLTNTTTTLAENTDTTGRIKVADIVVSDDGQGMNVLSLAGADAAMFELEGNTLYLRAGTLLDYQTNRQLDVTVEVDDPMLGTTPEDAVSLSITVTAANGDIHGTVWNDLDGDGVWDTDEPGRTNAQVYLDLNTNGQYDSGEPTTTSAGDGSYAFLNLLPGTYTVAEVAQSGWLQTFPSMKPEPIELASVASYGVGASGFSCGGSINADGRYVAFESEANNLLLGDTNGSRDIFVYDRQTNLLERVSLASNGSQATGDSYWPSISADGRYVAFYSDASNLVPGDTNGCSDVFVYDRQTGMIERLSIASNGSQANDFSRYPSISGDGRYVAFESYAGNLVPGDTNRCGDVFVYDRQTDAIERVSTAFDGSQTAYGSSFPSFSGDGRYVAFESCATNLIPGDTNARGDVFVYDRQAHAIKRVSMAFDGSQANDNSSEFSSISADGRYVAFASYATNLVPGDTNGLCDVFVYDQQTGTIERVSTAFDGSQTNGVSCFPSISGDGRYVAFESYATSLVRGDTNGYSDVFVHDRQADASERVSIAFDGVQANRYSFHPSISADGRYVAFQSAASNLVPRDRNLGEDIFVTQTAPSQPSPHTVILAAGQVAAGINFGNHVQTAPLAGDDAHQVDEDTPLVLAASGVLGNDTDVDNDLLSAHLVTGPSHGSLTLNADGSFTYLPAANYSGLDSFTYKVHDGHEYSNVATVVITVQPINDPPTLTLTNQTTTLAENASTTSRVKVADILVSDDDLGTHELTLAGDDAAMFAIVGSELYLKAGTRLDYETDVQLEVTVTVDDPQLGSTPDSTASLSITITDVGPTAEAGGAYTVGEGGTVVLAGSGLAYGGGSEGLAYAWDFDGDGEFDDATGPAPTFPALFDGPRMVTIALQVTEQGESSVDTATMTITNVAPRIIELTAPQMSGENLTVTVSGRFQDGFAQDGHTVLIDWGDGTSSPATVDATLSSFTANHSYDTAGQYTVTATVQDDDGGVAPKSLSIEVVPYLGAVGFATARIADLAEGDQWFCLETTREGYLTVEGLATGGGTLQLELYDVGSPWLSAATVLGNGKKRLDVEAPAHERYYLRVQGTGTGVELCVANLVRREGQTIGVFGTAGEDEFAFDATSQSVTVNGLTYQFTGDVDVHFDGTAGTDSAVLTGSSGNDAAVLTASGGRLSGPGYRVTLANIAQTTVDAGEGTDTVYLNGTEDEDTFTAEQGEATLAGTGYSLKVTGFEAIHGIGAGGGDTAVLRDSAGAERLVARPEDAQLHGQGFYLQAKGFSEVTVHATPGSGDRAELYDSRGNDTLTASPSTATLAGTGFSLTAAGFDSLVASASGGHDRALLTGSEGRDEFSAYPQYSLLRGEGYSLQVNHFDEARADGQGGGDVARLYDSLGDDVFTAQGLESRFAGIGFATTAVGFANVLASALRGGQDTACLQVALGESAVTITPHAGTLAGPGYACRAQGFANLVDASPTEPQGTRTLTTTQIDTASSMPQPGTLVLSGTKVAPSAIVLASGNSAPLLAVPHVTGSLRLADAESEAEAGLQVIDKLADAVHAADSAEPSIAAGAALLPSSETCVLVESQERSLRSLYESLAYESAKPKASGRKDQEALALVVDRLFESEIWE
jgi:ELWxxDGT repeat protein/predicted outer membrane repeat protein